jgi:uncharacterized protein (DUF2147 family)
MFRVLFLLATAVALTAAADAPPEVGAGGSKTIEGQWRNTRNTVHLKVSPCGESLCGTVIWAAPEIRANAKRGSGQELIGRSIFQQFQRGDEGQWRGKVYLPDLNTNVSATVTPLDHDTILVSGCMFMKIACKTQHWWRMK